MCLPVRRLCEMVDDGRHGRQEDATTGPLLRSAAQPTRVCANKANWESATNYNSHTQHRPQVAHLLFSPQAARRICIHASLHPCIHASLHPCISASLHPCICCVCKCLPLVGMTAFVDQPPWMMAMMLTDCLSACLG